MTDMMKFGQMLLDKGEGGREREGGREGGRERGRASKWEGKDRSTRKEPLKRLA